MNEDLENRIRKQRLRQPPESWRGEILAAARTAAAGTDPHRRIEPNQSAWQLFWVRFPLAWGALGAAWALVITANVLLFSDTGPKPQPLALVPQPYSILVLQIAEFRQLTEGEDTANDEPNPHLAVPLPNQPRSEQRRTQGVGELETENRFASIS